MLLRLRAGRADGTQATEKDVEMYSLFECYLTDSTDSRHPDAQRLPQSVAGYLKEQEVETAVCVGIATDYW